MSLPRRPGEKEHQSCGKGIGEPVQPSVNPEKDPSHSVNELHGVFVGIEVPLSGKLIDLPQARGVMDVIDRLLGLSRSS